MRALFGILGVIYLLIFLLLFAGIFLEVALSAQDIGIDFFRSMLTVYAISGGVVSMALVIRPPQTYAKESGIALLLFLLVLFGLMWNFV